MIASTHAEAPALVRAAQWIEAVMLGPIATTIAVLAIASLGFAMLSGRLSVGRGVTALLGCFITFGAASIAHGIVGLARDKAGADTVSPPMPAVSAPPFEEQSPQAPPAGVDGDPYAGASIRN